MTLYNNKKEERIVLHVDLDAFFASCEEVRKPWLKNKPVVIGSDPKKGKGRGVVSTANYPARKYGIKSAMPISWAYKRCPRAFYLPVDSIYYKMISKKIMQILKSYSEKFEKASIDEAYLELNDVTFSQAEKIAMKIKNEVFDKERLTCSVGIAPNKFVAKVASDFDKPGGLTVVKKEDVASFIEGIGLSKLHGVGPKSLEKLRSVGIDSVRSLRDFDTEILRSFFGESYSAYLRLIAWGIDERKVEEKKGKKSISRMVTFKKDLKDEKKVLQMIKEISDVLNQELLSFNLSFRTVKIIIRYSDFSTYSRQKSLSCHTNRLEDIINSALSLIRPFLKDRSVRLVGVALSNLRTQEEGQKRL